MPAYIYLKDFEYTTDKKIKKHMNTIKLFTIELNEGHRGETKLFVNDGIRGNISKVLSKLNEQKKLGDCLFDLCSLRGLRGEFAILRTSGRDSDNFTVIDLLRKHSGLLRIRLGEILSFKIFEGPFVRVWITFEEDDSKVSWSLINSAEIQTTLQKRLEYSVRVREGKTNPLPQAISLLEKALNEVEVWSPSDDSIKFEDNPINLENHKSNSTGLKTKKAKDVKLQKLRVGKKLGTQG